MARINNKIALIDYIKTQLGHPSINIEVTDPQIEQIIDDSVQHFTEYAFGTLEATALVQFSGAKEYPLPDTITNIIKLAKGSTSNIANFSSNFGSGYVPDLWSNQFFSNSMMGDIISGVLSISTTRAMLDKYFGDDIVFNFNPHKKILQVLENYIGSAVLHYQYEYLADEENDLIYNHEWIKAYTKAKVKELWGGVVGKYDQSLVGGARINYADIKSEAQSEIEKLDEELLTKWSDPCPISVA